MPIRSPELLDRVWAAVFAAKYDTDVEEAVLAANKAVKQLAGLPHWKPGASDLPDPDLW